MQYSHIKNISLFPVVAVSLLFHCGRYTVVGDETGNTTIAHRIAIAATIAKWFDNHTAAASITFDIPVPVCNEAVYATLNRSLTVDVEMVTSSYMLKDKSVFRDIESFSAQGVHYFGHGHQHYVTYDSMTYDSAFAGFDTCFRLMREWNLSPMVYAYPGGSGRLAKTQRAVADAGFICGRGVQVNKDSLFICADDQTAPEKWFCLPSVCIGNLEGLIPDHAGMVELFDKNLLKKSWLIPMYHSLGIVNGYAYYPMEDYLQDLDYLRSSDTWVANMDVVARYIMERNNCRISYTVTGETDNDAVVETVFQDTVDTLFEMVPLTIIIEVNGERSFNRCEVMDVDGATIAYRIVENRFSLNVVPNGSVVRMRFFEVEEE